MSIWTQPEPEQIDPVQSDLEARKAAWRATLQRYVTEFETDVNAFWAHGEVTPAQRLEALRIDAADVFDLSAKRGAFLVEVCAERLPELAQRVVELSQSLPAHTVHGDGRVTLDDVDDGEGLE